MSTHSTSHHLVCVLLLIFEGPRKLGVHPLRLQMRTLSSQVSRILTQSVLFRWSQMLKILCCAEIKGIKERLWFMNLAVFSGSVGLEYRREQENKLEEHEWGAPGRGLACAHRAGFSGSPTPLHVIAPWALRVCGPGATVPKETAEGQQPMDPCWTTCHGARRLPRGKAVEFRTGALVSFHPFTFGICQPTPPRRRPTH